MWSTCSSPGFSEGTVITPPICSESNPPPPPNGANCKNMTMENLDEKYNDPQFDGVSSTKHFRSARKTSNQTPLETSSLRCDKLVCHVCTSTVKYFFHCTSSSYLCAFQELRRFFLFFILFPLSTACSANRGGIRTTMGTTRSVGLVCTELD